MPRPTATSEAARSKVLAHNVQVLSLDWPVSIESSHVNVAWVDAGRTEQLEANSVVLCLHHEPNRELSEAVRESRIVHHR
jgi:hypothetical protein